MPGVRRWFDEAVDRDLFTSMLVAGELRRGVESIRAVTEPRQTAWHNGSNRSSNDSGIACSPLTPPWPIGGAN